MLTSHILHTIFLRKSFAALLRYQVLFFTLFFISTQGFSQLYYTVPYTDPWDDGYVRRVEPDFSYSTVVSINGQLSDIALSPTGIMYGINYSVIFHVNLENGELTPLDTLPFGDQSVSLVCSHDHHLYTLAESGVLYAYDILHDSLKLIDYLVYDQAGDIAFYRGNIIFQGNADETFFAYNLEERTVTWIICNSIIGYRMNAIGSRVDSCGEETLYGMTTNGNVYQFNIDNNSLTLLHQYGSLNFRAYGMATISESLGSTCSEQLSGQFCNPVDVHKPSRHQSLSIFPNPAKNQLFISYQEVVDVVSLYSADGRLIETIVNPLLPINVQDLDSGTYFLQITSGAKTEIKILLIQE